MSRIIPCCPIKPPARSLSGRWFAVATILLGILSLAPRTTAQNVIFVTTTEDKVSASGGCSLQEAIYSANFDNNIAIDPLNFEGGEHFITTGCVAGSGDDTIVLPNNAVFQLSTLVMNEAHNPFGPTGTPIIFSHITIEANGSLIEHVGPQNFRAFAVGTASVDLNPGGTPNVVSGTGSLTVRNAHIKGFTVKGGNGSGGGGGGMGAGGAIYLQAGGLTIENSTFDGNRAVGGNGSAISSGAGGGGGGLSGNGGKPGAPGEPFVAGGGGGGSRGDGGMGASGVIGNFFFGGGGGGGGTVTNGFSPNTSAGLTDGGFNCGGQGGTGAGDFSEDNDGHAGFCPGGGGGGGVAENIGILAESGNGANGNYGGGGGGGGYASGNGGDGGFGGGGGSSMDFLGTTSGSGGNGGFGGGGGGGQGGIIFGGPGHGGTFAGNGDAGHGGGGAALGSVIFNDSGSVVVRNSTFTGNSVYRGDSGGGSSEHGSDAGAAIFSVNGHLTVLNATISFNHATGTGAGVVLLQIGLPPPPASFILENTIISNNSSMECAFAGFSISGGGAGNLIQNNDDCPGVVSSSDPLLGPLQNNVGFTPTMAIPKTSPAFNAADPATSLATDQRGQARPALGGFDIGAFELCQNFFGIPCVISAGIEQTEPLTVVISPPAAGKTTPPAGVTNEPLGSVTVLTATGNPGFSFIDWTGNVTDATNPSTTIIMSEAQTVTANFVSCGCAGDVSASITLSRGGFVLNPATGRYTQTVVLTNYSASIITGPISLVLDSLSANATLLNATGTTDSLESPAGSPYLSANVNLAPGQTTSLALQFTDPTHGTITYDTRVLAGPGAR